MFRNLILSAAAAGLAAGLLTAALQHVTTTPLIIEAERYEGAAAPGHQHSAVWEGVVIATHGGHEHGEEEWAPADGIERTLHTSLATVVTGVGFALVLLAAMVLTDARIDGRTGLAFGVGGFAAAALAPALGLPPEIPGSAAAELANRQVWWLFTAVATAAGLYGLLLSRRLAFEIGGVVLIVLPHLVGAPDPVAYESTAPAELAGHFAAASLVVSAVFWALLGFASGSLYERFSRAS